MKFKILICGILLSLMNIYPLGETRLPKNGSPVTYEPSPDQIQTFFLEIRVRGKGSVVDGTASIENGTVIYEMKYADSKTLTLKPGENNYVKRVTADGHDMDASQISSFSIMHMRHDMKVYIEFAQRADENESENIVPPDQPVVERPDEKDPEYEKEEIIIITQDIPVGDMDGEITDEFIRRYLDVNDDYEIISHNIQKELGIYEVTIRLSDGSIRKAKIKVVKPEPKNEDRYKAVSEDCEIHTIMLILILLYSGYSIAAVIWERKKISELKQRQRKEENK